MLNLINSIFTIIKLLYLNKLSIKYININKVYQLDKDRSIYIDGILDINCEFLQVNSSNAISNSHNQLTFINCKDANTEELINMFVTSNEYSNLKTDECLATVSE